LILIDSNVFMYAAGAEHPHKEPSVRLLELIASGEVEAAIDAEVLQEILHRYRAIGRWLEGSRLYEAVRRTVPLTFAITGEIVDSAHDLLATYDGLSARDALHAAVAIRHSASAICSYDRDFDRLAEVKRLQPEKLSGGS
jgi:predicted nucleic acid-binding protein